MAPWGGGDAAVSCLQLCMAALCCSLESVVCRLSAARCGAWPWGGEPKNDTRVLTRLRLQLTPD